jgi:hypothetical protein
MSRMIFGRLRMGHLAALVGRALHRGDGAIQRGDTRGRIV